MKGSVFWDIAPGSLFKNQPTFRRNILHPSSGFKSKPSKKNRLHVSPKRRLTLTGLPGIISQKVELFSNGFV
jgi:hypothetical protein